MGTFFSICRSALVTYLIATTLISMKMDNNNIKVSQLILIALLIIADLV